MPLTFFHMRTASSLVPICNSLTDTTANSFPDHCLWTPMQAVLMFFSPVLNVFDS